MLGKGCGVLCFGSSSLTSLLLGRRERGTCPILLPGLWMEAGAKSELPGLVLRNQPGSLL